MARIAGVNVPDNKHTATSLAYIYGVSRATAQSICATAGVSLVAKIKDLSDEQINQLHNEVTEITTEGDLCHEINVNIKHLVDLGCYHGLYHRRGLPAHGQRIETNVRIRKDPRKPIRK